MATGVALAVVVFGAVAAFATVGAAAGGHGTYLPAKVFFPFAMLSSLVTGSGLALVVAVLQFPIYAVASAVAILRRRTRRTVAALVLLHVLAAAACLIALTGDTYTP